MRNIEPHLPIGTNIFNCEWDILIVLDACRYDLFAEFAPKHKVSKYFTNTSSIRSVASTTKQWLPRTLDNAPQDIVQSTHYISSTSYLERAVDKPDLHDINHVWKYAIDPETGMTKPEAVTDAAIDAVRNSTADRFVVHYLQPHAPFLHCPGKYDSLNNGSGNTQNVWDGLREGRYDKDEVWQDYGKNLHRGLDEVETIVRDCQGDIIITSDHGNAMGEFGVHGHPDNHFIDSVRKVPWAKASGLGEGDYEVKGEERMKTMEVARSVENHLHRLGYLD